MSSGDPGRGKRTNWWNNDRMKVLGRLRASELACKRLTRFVGSSLGGQGDGSLTGGWRVRQSTTQPSLASSSNVSYTHLGRVSTPKRLTRKTLAEKPGARDAMRVVKQA